MHFAILQLKFTFQPDKIFKKSSIRRKLSMHLIYSPEYIKYSKLIQKDKQPNNNWRKDMKGNTMGQ